MLNKEMRTRTIYCVITVMGLISIVGGSLLVIKVWVCVKMACRCLDVLAGKRKWNDEP